MYAINQVMKGVVLTSAIFTIAVLIAAGPAAYCGNDQPGKAQLTEESFGSFYINDCGQPHGGFEYCGCFYASLFLEDSIGTLTLELTLGLGDPLLKHEYSMELIEYSVDSIEFLIEGEPLVLEWVENDTVWNKWHNHYIASFIYDVPERGGIGTIHPDMFPGLVSWYYVELRLPGIMDYSQLSAEESTLSAGTGGTVNFSLDAGMENANQSYILLGSVTVTKPGTPLPNGIMRLPFTWDPFTHLVMVYLNTPLFANFQGTLDSSGQAASQINTGPLPLDLIGAKVYFSFVCYDPINRVSNPVYIEIVE